MTFFEKRVALLARLDTLERHAQTLEGAPTTSALEAAELAIDGASSLLSSIGRLT